MSLVLKSNVKMPLRKLSDVVIGAKIALDFRDETYFKNGAPVVLSNLIESEQSMVSGKTDASGNYYSVAPNTARISIDPLSLKKGLFIEAAHKNYFRNSYAPVSQDLLISRREKNIFILRVVGSGSVEARFTDPLQLFDYGVATEGNPLVITPRNTPMSDPFALLSLTVIGDVSYAELSNSDSQSRGFVTRVKTLADIVDFTSDKVKFKSSAITDVLPNWQGCIVIRQHLPSDIFNRVLAEVETGTIMQINNNSGKGIYVGRQENGSASNVLRVNSDTETDIADKKALRNNNIYALNFSKTTAKLAHNGTILSLNNFTAIAPTNIFIGSGSDWSTNTTQYVQEVLIFDRQLTDDELIKITTDELGL